MFSSKLRMIATAQWECHKCMNFIGHLINNKSQFSNIVGHQSRQSEKNGDDITSDDEHIKPDLSVITDNKNSHPPTLKTVSVIPGKGPPPEPPVTCCMSGCVNCVWISYAEELKEYYGDGGEMARKALDHIEDPSLKAFIKLELGLK